MAASPALPPAFLEQLAATVGPHGVLTTPSDTEPYVVDWRGVYRGSTPAVVRPASTAEVAAVIRLCAQARVAVVPQGGNTGQCNAAVPRTGAGEIVLSLARMNRIRQIDALNNTMSVEAGCVLATLQQAAADADRLLPLSLGAEGSCQIGGNLSTNAGGANVLRYGNTRDLVLGIEAVLPDGRIWDGMRSLRKDNTGYDLKQLFIGAEGTLGVITAAVLKLFPRPRDTATFWAATPSPEAALHLLAALRRDFADAVGAFELMAQPTIALVLQLIPGTRAPVDPAARWHVLGEVAAAKADTGLRSQLEVCLAAALETGLITDAAVAESETAARAFWHLRESIPVAAKTQPAMVYRHDIALALSRVPAFIAEAGDALAHRIAGAQPFCFGHLGDGNLHYNVIVQGRLRRDPEAQAATDVNDLVYDLVANHGGSFSAEHGIGLAKVEQIARYKSPVEIDLMRSVKHALDPDGIMNPGKVLPWQEPQ